MKTQTTLQLPQFKPPTGLAQETLYDPTKEEFTASKQKDQNSENIKKQNIKERVILSILMTGQTLNRFEAEEYGDHCLHSTIATLRSKGYCFFDTWELIPSQRFGNVRVKRYMFAEK